MFHYQVMDGHELEVSLSMDMNWMDMNWVFHYQVMDGHELDVSLSSKGWT